MSAATQSKHFTPADLLAMPDGDRYELVDGHLVELNMSTWSSFVAGEMCARLRERAHANRGGWVFPEGTSYQCFPHAPERVRRADTSFITAERLSSARATEEGHCTIAPDLAVEVVSPNDLSYEIAAKVRDFLRAGVRLVWVVNPAGRDVAVHRLAGGGAIRGEQYELDGEDVLPGFRCRVGDLFQPPPGVQA